MKGASLYFLVESHGRSEDLIDDVRIVAQLLVDHESENAHLSGASVVV
jgi:hypothetical protein